MILLPKNWRLSTVRSVVNAMAWLVVAIGLYGGYREACGGDGWGSFIVMGFGILVITLLAASEEAVPLRTRALRLAAGLVLLPLSVVFHAIFQDFIRFACPA